MKFEIGFVFFIDLLADYDKSIAIKDKVLDELDKIDEIESVDVINDGEDWNIECLAIIDAPNGEEVKDIFEKKISSAEKVYLDETISCTYDYHYIKGIDNDYQWCP